MLVCFEITFRGIEYGDMVHSGDGEYRRGVILHVKKESRIEGLET